MKKDTCGDGGGCANIWLRACSKTCSIKKKQGVTVIQHHGCVMLDYAQQTFVHLLLRCG